MRRLKIALSLAVALALAAVAHAATEEVAIKDNFFKPERVEINKGDKVTWRWKGSDLHNVAIKKPDSDRISTESAFKTEGRFTHQFGRVGTWRIHCETHPRKMRMKVVVSQP
ncbi:MAG: cupredoxin domain-containing protein [Thermoleophilaceae bacterium]